MNRACAARACRIPLRGSLLLFDHCDRQQLRFSRHRTEAASAIESPPLKYLVRVHSILASDSCHRSAWCKRLFHHSPALCCTTPPSHRAIQYTHFWLRAHHADMLWATSPHVYTAQITRLPGKRDCRSNFSLGRHMCSPTTTRSASTTVISTLLFGPGWSAQTPTS